MEFRNVLCSSSILLDFEMCGIFKLFVFLQWNMWCFSSILCTFLVLCVDSCVSPLFCGISCIPIFPFSFYVSVVIILKILIMMFYETISLTCILLISLRIWLLLSVAILFSYIVTARLNWGKTYQIVIMNRLTKPTAICRYLRSLTIVISVVGCGMKSVCSIWGQNQGHWPLIHPNRLKF